MPYDDFVRRLGPLERFDPAVFTAGNGVSQRVCDFVLALAQVHGDIMNLFLAHELLGEVKPDKGARDTPQGGHWAGTILHLLRVQAGVIHELLTLIRRNRPVLADKGFSSLLVSLPDPARKQWQAIASVAMGGRSPHPFAKALAVIRHKVAFHYDADQIGRAYKAHLTTTPELALLSKGEALGASRFYFADAVADYFLLSKDSTGKAKKALLDPTVMEGIAALLFCLVTYFLEMRAS